MKKAKFVIALIMSTILATITTMSSTASADTETVISYPGDAGDSTWFSIDEKAYLSAAVTCAERIAITGNPCNWSANLYGELAIFHEEAEASFGYNGFSDNEMPKSRFVQGVYGKHIENFSKSASMFTFIKEDEGATATLYY